MIFINTNGKIEEIPYEIREWNKLSEEMSYQNMLDTKQRLQNYELSMRSQGKWNNPIYEVI